MYSLLLLLTICSQLDASPDGDFRPPVNVDPYVMLPLPMSADELPQMARILMLSEAQEALVATLFRQYQDSLAALEPKIDELNRRERDRSTEDELVDGQWVERDPPLTMQEMYDLATGIVRDTRSVESELMRIEEEFFSEIAAILAESQQSRLPEARRSRNRIAYQVRTDALPGAQADFIEILQSQKIEIEDDESLTELMRSHEERFVQLLQLRHNIQSRVHLRELQWLATYVGSGNISQRALDERGRIRLPQLRLESAIRRLNVSTMEALSIMLDDEVATEVQDSFYRAAHPTLSADRCVDRTRKALLNAVNREDLVDDIVAEVEYLRERFLANHQRLQRRLSDLDFDHHEKFYRTLSAHVGDFAAHSAGVEAINAEIRDLCQETTQRIELLLAVPDESDHVQPSR